MKSCSRMHEGHDLLDPAAPFPIQEDGDLWNGFRDDSLTRSVVPVAVCDLE